MSSKSVIVIGGGLAGLSSGVALASAGYRVTLIEKRPFLGGRATSYVLPCGEHIDNCQHVTLGCCTNLEDFYRRAGAADKIRYYDGLIFAASDGRRGAIRASASARAAAFRAFLRQIPLAQLGGQTRDRPADDAYRAERGPAAGPADIRACVRTCSIGCGVTGRPKRPFALLGSGAGQRAR